MLDIAVNMVDHNCKDLRFDIMYVNNRYIEPRIPGRFMKMIINECFEIVTSCTKHCLVTLENMRTNSKNDIDIFIAPKNFF